MTTEEKRVAAIDIGTNSVLLTVAKCASGPLEIVEQLATVTRLGQDVDRTGELHPDAITRTLECLGAYRERMDALGVQDARAVGTSAMRDARGGSDFVQRAKGVLGFAPEIISGRREAELTFLGALSGLEAIEAEAFVFDIGGGSTELIVGTQRGAESVIDQGMSLDMGSVRLTERFELSDPPTSAEMDQVRCEIRKQLENSSLSISGQPTVVGVAGTVTTLAAIHEKMADYDPAVIHGYRLAASIVSELSQELATMTVAQKRELPGLTPGRADVIAAGAALCDEILKFARAEELTVSDRGVRFGLLAELMTSPSS